MNISFVSFIFSVQPCALFIAYHSRLALNRFSLMFSVIFPCYVLFWQRNTLSPTSFALISFLHLRSATPRYIYTLYREVSNHQLFFKNVVSELRSMETDFPFPCSPQKHSWNEICHRFTSHCPQW